MLATSWTLRAAFHTNRRVVLQIQRPSNLAFARARARGFASEGPSTSTSYPGRIIRRAKTTAKYGGYLCLSTVFGVLFLGAGIFVHDAFTYTDKHVERVPVSPLALHPERGGPKNLPVAKVLVADEEDEENVKLAHKPKLVIVGGGWGVSAVNYYARRSCTN